MRPSELVHTSGGRQKAVLSTFSRFIAAKSRVAILKTADCTSSRATRRSTGNQAISVHH